MRRCSPFLRPAAFPVARRVVDRRVLHLIKMWLDCPVEETDDRGRKTRTTEARDQRRGIPQGSPLSPLLANLYMRRFVLGWKKLGLERSLGTRLVTYADDLVILCRRGNAEAALHRLREIMGKLKLTVNEDKTQICKVPEGEFDFLGFTFGRMYSRTTGQARLALRPSKKSIKRMVDKISRPGHHASHPRWTPAARADCRQATGALTFTAGLARAAHRARPCLSRSELKARPRSLTPKATDVACGQPRQSREPHPAALRYWNITRQRHYHSSARYCAASRVSADPVARHSPQTGGKPGLCHERRRNPERDGLSAGGRWIRTSSSAREGLEF